MVCVSLTQHSTPTLFGLGPGAESGSGSGSCTVSCESDQQHVVIPVRNEGKSQLNQGNMWES